MRIDQKTVDAQHHGLLTQLVTQSATVPWDARAALDATVDDLSETMVREHLRACGSALLDEPDARTIYRKMDIVRRVNDHEVPRNVGLLFFSRDPARWFQGARIETSIQLTGAGGDVLEEKEFRGGLAEQVRGCLAYLRREVIESKIHKVPNQLRASNQSSYPEDALQATLFAHPWQSAASVIRKAGELRAVGRPDAAVDALESAWRADPSSLLLAEELVRQCVGQGDLDRAEPVIKASSDVDVESRRPNVVVPWLEALVVDGQGDRAHRFLGEHGTSLSAQEAIGAAIVSRRLRDSDMAAKLFDVAGPAILEDPRALLESAQNKLWLAGLANRDGRASENRVLLEDARVLLRRLLGMDGPRRRHAWAWRELGRVRRWLGEPASAVDEAYAKAIELAPDETKFRDEHEAR